MRPEEEVRSSEQPARNGGSSLGGGADSSNRPWETDSLRVDSGGSPPRFSLLATCAAAILSLADIALAYAAEGGYGFGLYQPFEALPQWRLIFSHGAGLLLLPLYIPGYWSVFRTLRDTPVWLSWPVFALGSATAMIAAACHGEIALRSLLVQAGFRATASDRLLGLAREISDPLSGWINLPLALASLCFACAVLSGRAQLPRWLVWANPMVLALVLVAPSIAAPSFAPALITAAASYNLGHLAFFSLMMTARRTNRPDQGLLTESPAGAQRAAERYHRGTLFHRTQTAPGSCGAAPFAAAAEPLTRPAPTR